MKNFFSAVILAISTSLSISAQDINGVELYDEMTHAEVLEMFGEPTKYEEYDDQYEGFSRWYYYGENYLHFRDDVLEEFAIFDSSYTTLEEYRGAYESRPQRIGPSNCLPKTQVSAKSKDDV